MLKKIYFFLFLCSCSYPLPKNQKIIIVSNKEKTKTIRFAQNRKWIGFPKDFNLSLKELRQFSNLKSLEIFSPQFFNLGEISFHSQLTFLNLSHTSVNDLQPIFKLKKLRTLILNRSKVTDKTFENFKLPKNITKLSFAYTKVTSLKFISSDCSLRVLDIRYTKIKVISFLKHCQKLIELKMGNSLINDIQALFQLKNLTYLEIDNLQLNKLELERLKKKNRFLKIVNYWK